MTEKINKNVIYKKQFLSHIYNVFSCMKKQLNVSILELEKIRRKKANYFYCFYRKVFFLIHKRCRNKLCTFFAMKI